MNVARVLAVVDRELGTVARTRAYLALAVGFWVAVVGLAWAGGVKGYVPIALNLLTPMEILVPVLAFALGYRAISTDARSGELEVLQTFPVTRGEFVLGVFLGRAGALLAVLLVPLAVVMLLVAALGGAATTVIATHGGTDSPLLFVRFAVLTAGFGLVALAVAIALSAGWRRRRGADAAAVAVLLVLVVGLDLAVVAGLATGVVGAGALEWVLALSPASAYRGLVLETVVRPLAGEGLPAARPAANLAGLLVWFAGALAAAGWLAWHER